MFSKDKKGFVVSTFVAVVFLMFIFAFFFCNLNSIQSNAQASASTSIDNYTDFEKAVIKLNQKDNETNLYDNLSSMEMDEEQNSKFKLKRLIVQGDLKDSYGATDVYSYGNLHILSFDSEELTQQVYEELCKDSSLDVTIDQYHSLESYADKEYDYSSYKNWGAQAIDVGGYRQFLSDKNVKKEVVVVVIDTGLNTSHEMFKDRLITDGNGKIKGYSYFNSKYQYSYNNLSFDYNDTNKYSFEDDCGHGTHVAGIICNLTPSNVKILPIKIGNPNNDNKSSSSIMLAAYLRVLNIYSKEYNVVCTNLSYSGAGKSSESDKNTFNTQCYIPLKENNILAVTSAGNDADENNIQGLEAIVVSALKKNEKEYLFDYSYSNFGEIVDISAPGSSINSAWINSTDGAGVKSYRNTSGTSMASPQVAGAVALFYLNPYLDDDFTAIEIEERLYNNCLDLGFLGKDIYYGHGLVNIKYFEVEETETLMFYRDNVLVEGYIDYESFEESFDLKISCSDPNFKIFYTTDKSIPNSLNGNLYSQPIKIKNTVFMFVIGLKIQNGKIIERTQLYNISYFYSLTPIEDCFVIDYSGTITKYTGQFDVIEVPRYIRGIEVKSLNPSLFKKNKLKSISLPKSCTTIAGYVFEDCQNLQYIYAPGVTKVYIAAFYNSGITFVSDETPEEGATEGCYLPSLKDTVSFTFAYCENLVSVKLSKATFNHEGAECDFIGCVNLEEVSLPSMTIIPPYTFYNCPKLETFTVTKNISKIRERAFTYNKLKNIYVEPENTHFYSDDFGLYSTDSFLLLVGTFQGDYVIRESVVINNISYAITTLGQTAVTNCRLESLYIPKSISNIDKLFAYESTIKTLYFNAIESNNSLYWDEEAFVISPPFGNAEIEELHIGKEVKVLPERLFQTARPKKIIINSIDTKLSQACFYIYNSNIDVSFEMFLDFSETTTSSWLQSLQNSSATHELKTLYSKTSIKSYKSYLGSFNYIGVHNNYFVYSTGGGMVKTSVTGQGTINPSGEVAILEGCSKVFEIIPSVGWMVKDVKINGKSVGIIDSYTFSNIESTQTISVEFVEQYTYFTITVVNYGGGEISPNYNKAIKKGGSQTYDIVANVGYEIIDVKIDGVSKGALTTYTFSNITSDHKIEVWFAKKQFKITSSSNSLGSISPSGTITVEYNGSQKFEFVPKTGCYLATITIDDTNLTSKEIEKALLNGYTFNNVVENHNIIAVFKVMVYEINASSGNNGTISPSGIVKVNHGESKTFYFEPMLGYEIHEIHVDGVYAGTLESYTFENVTKDHEINVTFKKIVFTITAQSNGNGKITPLGISYVSYGQTVQYYITPENGYRIKDVKINNVSIGAVTKYIFKDIKENKTIQADFEIKTYTISLFIEGKGNVSCNDDLLNVKHGQDIRLEITSEKGWEISEVLVNNNYVQIKDNELYISNITEEMNIEVVFKEKPSYTLEIILIVSGLVGTISLATFFILRNMKHRRKLWNI